MKVICIQFICNARWKAVKYSWYMVSYALSYSRSAAEWIGDEIIWYDVVTMMYAVL